MKFNNAPAHKLARRLIEAAKRQTRKNSGTQDPAATDVQVQVQLLLNELKKELKKSNFQVF